jgi:endonuclease I
MLDLAVIEDTENRYSARKSERDTTKRKIETKPLIQVDTPDRVEKRLARLGIKMEMAEAIFAGEAAPVPPTATAAAMPGEPLAVTDIEAVTLERVLGKSDLLGVSYLEAGVAASRSVGRIRIRNEKGRIVGFGTGFKVSPKLLLTNNHVLHNTQEAAFSQVEFNFQDGRDGRPLAPVVFDLDPGALFITDRALDFSLVAIKDVPSTGASLQSFGFCPLIEAEGKILLGEYASIIQHPNGLAKQIALRENQVIDILDNFLHYETDTAPGSSGSAVFSDQWEVVALHHSGVPKRDQQNRILSTSGAVWTQEMGEDKVAWIANEGVRISRIIKHIKNQNLPTAQRQLRTEMLERTGDPTPTIEQPEILARPPRKLEAGQPITAAPVAAVDGSVSWTIPITLSVRLGALATGQPITVSSGEQPAQVDAAVDAAQPPTENADLREALAELEAAKTKPYYNEAEDKKGATAYFKGLPGQLSPAQLFSALSNLVQKTHKVMPKYKPSTHVYPWVDLQPNLKLRSIYSGIEFDPQDFITEDFRIDQERADRFRESIAVEAMGGAERMAEELDLLEATLPYNCEHVVCQSWFGKREPMRGDLHHLFALEGNCNSFRGNTPYFDFEDFQEVVREDCGKRETNQFEPTAGKGAVARATFYFLLRYPGEINQVFDVYDKERLKMLLAWHADNPVTVYESHRNQAIFAVQGNRNPFIDRPQWAKKVDFTKGL